MKRFIALSTLLSVLSLSLAGPVLAEARRDGGDQALKKAQYLIRQLSQQKSALEAKVAGLEQDNDKLQSKLDKLKEEKQHTEARLESSRDNNEKLVARVRSDVEKYKELLQRYRETATTLKHANADNQYLVKAVQEREAWIDECRKRNDGLYEANMDLLTKYKDVAAKHSEPFTGIGKVEVENEFQDYRFKLEDLQVTQYTSSVDVDKHRRHANQVAVENTTNAGGE